MSRIPQSFLDDLLSRIDIVDVVDHRVKLKRSGKNYSACCPFHDEKTPSFTVSPEKQFYYCFGCGANGTAINFLMEYERTGFIDAIESLAKLAGVEVPREQNTAQQDAREQQRKRCYAVLNEANEYYQEQLKLHPQRSQATQYLQNRGLSGQVAKFYNLGYAPPGWDNLMLRHGQSESAIQLLIDAGLCVERPEENKRYDRFRQRIMFPIRDVRGRCIGFGGRVLDDSKPKYLNSPETEVFHKGKELYGLYEARQHKGQLDQLIVVEGYMDVIALAQYGIYNAVATLGTACGADHLTLAFRYVKDVVFCFDGDKAGRTAAQRALQNSLSGMEDGRQIRFLFLPDGQDPDSMVRQIGHERFLQQIKNAQPLEQFLFDVAAEGVNLNSLDGRARFAKNAAPMLHQLPEGIFRSLMYDNLAKRTGLSTEQLREFTDLPAQFSEPVSETQALTNTANATPKKQRTDEREYVPTSADELMAAYADLSDSTHAGETQAQPAVRQRPRSSLALSPAKRATILLLDHPQLLQVETHKLEACDEADDDLHVLRDLMDYLQKRPQANFNNIMGWWGGSHGADAQQALATLVAHELFGQLKNLSNYDASKEFSACLNTINRPLHKQNCKKELAALNAKGLAQLSADEKKRYKELILSSNS